MARIAITPDGRAALDDVADDDVMFHARMLDVTVDHMAHRGAVLDDVARDDVMIDDMADGGAVDRLMPVDDMVDGGVAHRFVVVDDVAHGRFHSVDDARGSGMFRLCMADMREKEGNENAAANP